MARGKGKADSAKTVRTRASATPVTSVKHKDKRKNIPTKELRDFVKQEEEAPTKILYPRDPSLDPQLVWKGKDEQDAKDLEVPAVPIYIQEKIHPQAIIENVRSIEDEETGAQPTLFSDFNGIAFEELIDFYHHEQNWSNRMILGDSLLVMTSLAEKEGLKGKVQMIYMDPPYGIKFGSNWQVSTRKRDVKDGKAEDATRQPEQVKAFRDTWEKGIHSYLAYLRDRLVVVRELLTESGSVFVQISDENLHLVRCLMDEVFGSENYISVISFSATTGQTSRRLAQITDYLLWFGKDTTKTKFRELYRELPPIDDPTERYVCVEEFSGRITDLTFSQKTGEQPMPDGRILKLQDVTSQTGSDVSRMPYSAYGKTFTPSGSRGWSTNPDIGLPRVQNAGYLHMQGNSLWFKAYRDKFRMQAVNAVWLDTRSNAFSDQKTYVVQTGAKVIERCLLMTTDPGDLVLDPTCGSGTTAYVAEQWGRRWITCDTSRVAVALARTRLMAGRFPYYLLADTQEGALKEGETTGRLPDVSKFKFESDIKKGFVYKRVPHVTLKSIANNEEIDVIHAKHQTGIETALKKLNTAIKETWAEWQVPFEPGEKWSETSKKAHAEFFRLRLERQKEIDASIGKRADTELLVDQPYEENKKVRVTGPFTVESLSPHRVLAVDEPQTASEKAGRAASTSGQFETMIIENLKKAGVQNTFKKERLTFDRLEPFSGVWLHAAGEYSENRRDGAGGRSCSIHGARGTSSIQSVGKTRRVAVSIGPEHGTVGPEQVKEAAKEAVKGVGYDILIICGFAFDPHVTEEAKRYGNLAILMARMNPDLAMGDELLKKTGGGNLFMVFGEPDLDIKKQKDGKLTVKLKGVDIYDPTTGAVRSNSTDDIACWFLDTNYNGESFFVRHAYFTGADEPYEKLKRALRAEIDEAAWSALYATESIPFDQPKTGNIAIKVINHYGDEVMQVYETKK